MHPIAVLAQAVSQTQEAWQVQMITMILGVLGTVLTVMVPTLLGRLIKKYHLENLGVTADLMSSYVLQGISYAEEQALKAANGRFKAPSSQDKLSMAVSYVLAKAEAAGLPKMASDDLIKLIEAHMPAVRQSADPAQSNQPQA